MLVVKRVRLFCRVYGRRGLESMMENSVLFGCFCLFPEGNNKERRKRIIQMSRDVTVIL